MIKKKTMVLPLFMVYILIFFRDILAHDCWNNSSEFICKFGTKTPYRYIANKNDSYLDFSGCEGKKIWLMIRHGTRYPGKRDIKAMLKYLPQLKEKIVNSFVDKRSKLSANEISQFYDWKLSFNGSYNHHLTKEGENELIDLAERMQARFPTLFPDTYNDQLYKFKFTATQRAEESAKSFVLGLFGQYYSSKVLFPQAENEDPVLRFYKRCERWKIQVDGNSETYKEKNLFQQSRIFKNVVSEISNRIGFKLDYESLGLVYKICGFESAFHKNIQSPWCNLLTLNDVKVLEYAEDLKYYWADGYGFELNYKQACPTFVDMFTFFESSEKSVVTAYFAHSGTILKMLSALEIAKDESPLTHQSYKLHKKFRKWRVGAIDSFASNIAFVLYNCKTQGPSVLFLHQERQLQLSGCPKNMPCPISILKNKLPDTLSECLFDDICSMKRINIY